MEDLIKNEPVQRVIKFLALKDNSLKVKFLNNTAKTAKEAADSLKCHEGAIVKSLLLKTEDDFIICLVSGDKRCSLNKLKKTLNKKDISMANAKDVKDKTGFSIGGVSPVAHITKLEVIIDKSLNRFPLVFAAAGHPNSIFEITYKKLVNITNGLEKDVSE